MSDDLFARNAKLDAKLQDVPIEQAVVALAKSGKRNRHLIRLTAAGLALDVLLSVLLGVGYADLRHLEHQTQVVGAQTARNAENVRDACLSRNTARAEQFGLWRFIIGLSESHPIQKLTPAQEAQQKAQTATFFNKLSQIFAQEKCPAATTKEEP